MRTRESWSRQWYNGLSHSQHDANDEWFVAQLNMLKDSGFYRYPVESLHAKYRPKTGFNKQEGNI